MGKFAQRSTELELMDYPIERKEDIFVNFRELVQINRYLGGPSHSFNEIRQLVKETKQSTVVDIGFGAGDFLDYLHQRRGQLVKGIRLIGVDMMPEAKVFAQTQFPNLSDTTQLICADYRDWVREAAKPDIIHAALFCHHLEKDALIEFLRASAGHAKRAVVINDLHRHPLAFYSIKVLTQLFSKSRYTRNDAPLSVLRGFRRSELEQMLKTAGISDYTLRWKWAFRFILTIHTNRQ